ncbi:MAG: cysteine desulfurase [Marinoscillum sp.]|nr:cysteine desulfurase [Marinoscillum sp.]OUX27129.1 MAG: cysteine desulfurase [Flammeovirgaceae bacterium TMED262]|tara:strand:+ start:11115 stop:12248 length:1134 start_codon:yes stop_codon:yes gene_type:complete
MNVYFDNAATTPIDRAVLDKMLPYLENGFGNPSSIHKRGREIKSVIEKSRTKIATLLSCEPGEIFFTSGGTEADNMFILNTVIEKKIDTIITTKLEHHAVLHCCDFLEKTYNKNIKYIETDGKGIIDLSHLESLVKSNPNSLVSVMHGNNEIGNLNDIKSISKICQQYEVILHSDTVQTVGHYDINLNELNIHGIVGSAHKFHGPKGVGFLYLNNKHKISPFIHGGSQERNMRGGTENIYGIVGLAEALELSISNMENHSKKIENIKSYMIDELCKNIDGVKFNGQSSELDKSLYTVLNVSIPSRSDQQMFLFNLDINNIAASAGSACTSGSEIGSHVLAEVKKYEGHVPVRFSFSKMNNKEEVDYTIKKLCEILDI